MTVVAINTPRQDSLPADHSLAAWLRDRWHTHSYIIPSFAISLLVCAWVVTWGEFNFFEHETFCGYYDAQARSILHGHLDVPPNAIGFEAFIFRGKTYGYFGIAPAILRMPLVVLFKNMDWRWSRSIMLAGFFLNLLCAYVLLHWVRGPGRKLTRVDRTLNSLFILCAGLGSTNIFLVSRSYTYHEAIMLGGVFALLFAVVLVQYLAMPSLRQLALLGALAFMSFHSRPTAGAGALLGMCVVAGILVIRSARTFGIARSARSAKADADVSVESGTVRPSATARTASAKADPTRIAVTDFAHRYFRFRSVERPLPHAIVALLSIALTLGVYFGVNYAKFRTFDGVPLKYYSLYLLNPSRMQVTGGRQIHPENIPMALACYFGLRGAEFRQDFPWIYLSQQPSLVGRPALDIVEQYSSIPVSMPALGLLALLGCGQAIRGRSERQLQMRLPILVLALGGSIILMTVGITERYLHDLYPFLIAAGALGVLRFATGKPSVGSALADAGVALLPNEPADESRLNSVRQGGPYMARATPIRILTLLAIVSIVLNCLFSIEYQRMAVWGVPKEKRAAFQQFRQTMQNLFHGRQIPSDEE